MNFIMFINLSLNFLMSWLSYLYKLFFPSSDPRVVNFIDNWWCNYNMRNRLWRIPQLCNYIHNQYGSVAELDLLGQRIHIISDLNIVTRLMTEHGHSLRQRLGNEMGLKALNMYKRGLICNNDMSSWKRNRTIFEGTLHRGTKMLEELSQSYFEKLSQNLPIAQPISILSILRDYAISVTMEGLLGLKSTKTWRDRAILIVENYFKAWEFFLLSPDTSDRFPEEGKKHHQACAEMVQLSKEIYSMAMDGDSEFIQNLAKNSLNTENEIHQCISEMLMAGTDTSALTTFYTVLFLADHPEVSDKICRLIHSDSGGDENIHHQEITRLYFESMRLIPLGPAILRQAENDIQDGNIVIRKGDGIILNIGELSRNPSNYSNPNTFDLSRYEDKNEQFTPSFGIGRKSCAGKSFAEKQMKLFFTWLLKTYTVLGNHECMIDHLETRWDILTAPVGEIKLNIFPRILVHLVGQPQGKEQVVQVLKQEFPLIKIYDDSDYIDEQWKEKSQLGIDLEDDIVYLEYQLEFMQMHSNLMKGLDGFEFAIMSGSSSILECISRLRMRNIQYDDNNIEMGQMKKQLVIYFPYDDEEETLQNKSFLNVSEKTKCKYLNLTSKTKMGRVIEIMDAIASFNHL